MGRGTRGSTESLQSDHDVGLTPAEEETEGRKTVYEELWTPLLL